MDNRTSLGVSASIIILFFGLAVLVAAPARSYLETDEDMLAQTVSISLANDRVRAFARELANASRIKINVEEARRFSVPGDSIDTILDLAEQREKGITINVTDATVEKVLNLLLQEDDRYEYSVDAEAGTINIYPKENAPMGWMTGPLNITDTTVHEILVSEDLLGLQERNIRFLARGNLTWLQTRVTLESDSVTAREALNALCAQLDFKARWDTFEVGVRDGGAVWHSLMIHGFPGPPRSNE